MIKKKLCLAIIFALFITIFVFPAIICSTLVLTSVAICIPNMIIYKTMKHYNLWDKVKLNMIHRNVEIKLRSQKSKRDKFVLNDNEMCADY